MKKFVSILLAALTLTAALSGCGQSAAPAASAAASAAVSAAVSAPAASAAASASASAAATTSTGVTVRLGGLTGPTTMGMVKLLADSEQNLTANRYDFKLAGTADELTPLLVKGELDAAAVPINLGAVLFNKTQGGVELVAINTLGVLYIVENGGQTVTDWASLKGKTIYATGKGSTPEYVLRYLLSQNGLDADKDVKLEWKTEPSEVVAQMSQMTDAVAMLPQPYVTAAKAKLSGLRVALDLTQAWDALKNGSRLLTAGLVVRTQFAQEHPEAVAALLQDYQASADYVNANVAEAAKLVEKYGIVKAAVAEKAIPACNIVCISGSEMKSAAQGYLQILFDQNPKAVGGTLPGDGFYYAP
jgi:NitT/TauT family transport system substrate-binding protein